MYYIIIEKLQYLLPFAGEVVYKVKWEGYKKTTWEPLSNFEDFTPIQDYLLNLLNSKK